MHISLHILAVPVLLASGVLGGTGFSCEYTIDSLPRLGVGLTPSSTDITFPPQYSAKQARELYRSSCNKHNFGDFQWAYTGPYLGIPNLASVRCGKASEMSKALTTVCHEVQCQQDARSHETPPTQVVVELATKGWSWRGWVNQQPPMQPAEEPLVLPNPGS